MSEYRIIHSEKDNIFQYCLNIKNSFRFIPVLVSKDIKTKYSHTYLGWIWTLLGPFLSILLYILFFGFVLNINLEGESFALYVLSGYTCWNIISQSFVQIGGAIIHNQDIVKKISIPKITILLAKSVSVWLESILLIIVTLIAAIWMKGFGWYILIKLPLLFVGIFLFSTSLGILAASFTIHRRDILHGIPLLLQILIWFSPVFYPLMLLPESLKTIVAFNPITGFIEVFRKVLGITHHLTPESFIGMALSFILLVAAFIIIKIKEDHIVDYF